jgi:hypothetical protein
VDEQQGVRLRLKRQKQVLLCICCQHLC